MELKVPGDKSISQRALIFSALASGESRIRGVLEHGDPASTAHALRALGVEVPPLGGEDKELRITGLGLRGLSEPPSPLDLGNSGTGARLLMGVLAGQPLEATLTGDESLRIRPMARVTDPLTAMGARFHFLGETGHLPIRVEGTQLRPLDYRMPVASAQVKSAILIAGLVGGVPVTVWDPGRSRDHTERMLGELGVAVESGPFDGGWVASMTHPPERIGPLDLDIPGDFSSAAFFLLLGLLHPELDEVMLPGVGINETRTGLLPVLERMGGQIRIERMPGTSGGEPIGNLTTRPAQLRGVKVGGAEIPRLIDEIPILAVGAARAQGTTRITDAWELRVKETDRIRALVLNLRAVGVEAEEREDGLEIQGTDAELRGIVDSFGDHRIAMAFGILGALPGNEIRVRGAEVTDVSFPGFWRLLGSAAGPEGGPKVPVAERKKDVEEPPVVGEPGANKEPGAEKGSGVVGERTKGEGKTRRPLLVITLDGPAGSGKSTTAREVAWRLGYSHLDSGALYRALTFALISEGVPQEVWGSLTTEDLDRFHIHVKAESQRFLVLLGDRILEDELRSPEVTKLVSPLSALPAVRAWLLGAQRRAGREGGIVADGRDMGTVVFPDADVKVFLTARLPERAFRRFLERKGRDPDPQELETEARSLDERDDRDSKRAHAPLRKPPGALEVDTSDLSFDEQVEVILDHVKSLTNQ